MSNWQRAYREYLRGHNGYGDPLTYDEFRDRLETHGKLQPDSDPKTTKAEPPKVREPELGTSDDPLDYDLNAEGATGALVPANSKKKTPFANPHYSTRTDKPLAGRNQGKAESEGLYRPGNVGKIEDYRARGHTKIAGKHVHADGLVSRKGYRRILPDFDGGWRAEQIGELEHLAEIALRGRNRKIFTRNIIEPLDGKPGATYRELADQYGISISKIHRIIADCHMKIADAMKQEKLELTESLMSRENSKGWSGDWIGRKERVSAYLVERAITVEQEDPEWMFLGSSKHSFFFEDPRHNAIRGTIY